jgi:hypothetical protein
MSGIKWQEVLKDAVHNDSIKATELRKIPHLKACPRWDEAAYIGSIIHRTQFANYDGGLVRYGGRIYYVTRSQIDALRPWVKWNTGRILTVIEG